MADKEIILSLHRYFIWADRMRVHCEEILRTKREEVLESGTQEQLEFSMYMSFWYGELYVVAEGWKELKLSDSKIDELLKNQENLNYLRRYRNGVFHFQKEYFDARFMDLISEKSSPKWIRELQTEFSRYFLDYFKALK